ncbi:PREDICTED: probable E3 ubiquitin-protein ligase HERC4 [Priapulus caudatus]|uniref:HECT-type E3 ubiquitin transferase n=1 Tax=Priapulus caudatus TaxID=37621 RepID=A0ABM1EYN9_PRICU|nr:PREDICTED: probable E3 ubiquitin-protein ligase HERC4 [Priapulus caudatus]
MFALIGMLCGLAIYNFQIVDLHFPLVLYKKLMDREELNRNIVSPSGNQEILKLFQPEELMAMMVGNENYDWEELEKGASYKDEYSSSHPTIKMFWEVFHELTVEEKKKFLLFLTGCDRIPILGMKSIKMYIQPVRGGEHYLPVAHTCFNLLDLPVYTDKQRLQDKLTLAVTCTKGFGLA